MTGTEYQKIPGPFKRDPKTNKVIYGDWFTPELKALADLNIWNFTEKIDGTNTRIFWDGHRVTWAGRTDRAMFSAVQLNALAQFFAGPDNETLFEQQFGDTPAILYGELYGPGIQSGGVYRSDISYILFDVSVGGLWLTRAAVEEVAENVGIEAVPLMIYGVSLNMAIDHVCVGLYSDVANNNAKPAIFAEGLVGVTNIGLLDRRGNRIAVKVKHRDLYGGSR